MKAVGKKTSARAEKNKPTLTKREVDVLKCVSHGMTNKQIGMKLHISHRTVDTHRTNIMRKLNVHNVVLLIKHAVDKKII